MSLIHDIRTTIATNLTVAGKAVTDATPVLAAVGATDLAVEKARDLGERAKTARTHVELDPKVIQGRATARANELADQVTASAKEIPALTLNRGLEVATEAQKSYADLATRGKGLVERVRTQKATQDLVRQAESTVTLGKGAVTTVRKSAGDLQRSALATITTGRREAVKTADAVADTLVDEAQDAAKEVTETVTASAKRTRTAATRTSTTATKSAASTKRAGKATTTSAKKTATRTRKATTKAAAKVGD